MRWAWIVVVVAACGSGLRKADTVVIRDDNFEAAVDGFVKASQQGDVATIRRYLKDSVTVGGLWFDDVDCLRELSVGGEVSGRSLDTLARCLAGTKLVRSERVDSLPDAVLLTYDPGIEIEARIVADEDSAWLAWIGYVARRGVEDALPTVVPTRLEQTRLAGDAHPFVGGPSLVSDVTDNGFAYAWIKVCIDASGTVTGAHVREASSLLAARVFMDGIREWKFQPFMLRGQPSPVCSLIQTVYPPNKVPATAKIPLPLPSTGDPVTMVPPNALGSRIDGWIMTRPDEVSRLEMYQDGIRHTLSAFEYCVDKAGRVDRVLQLRSTGLPVYDRWQVTSIRSWRFHPYLDQGKPVPVCSSVTFVYQIK